MKTIIFAAALLAACSPPPSLEAVPPGAIHPYTGQKVEEIRHAITYNASVRVLKHLTYDPNWDGVLAGAIGGSLGQSPVNGASGMQCPPFWVSVWRQDDPGTTYAWYYAQARSRTVGYANYTPPEFNILYTAGCDYEFRNGGSGPSVPYIPVNSGNLWVAAWPTCQNPANGFGGVHAFDPILVYVAPGTSPTITMPNGYGISGDRATWQSVMTQCQNTGYADPAWGGQQLHIGWCYHNGPGGSCLSGSQHDYFYSW